VLEGLARNGLRHTFPRRQVEVNTVEVPPARTAAAAEDE
jgi:hypothetical protein